MQSGSPVKIVVFRACSSSLHFSGLPLSVCSCKFCGQGFFHFVLPKQLYMADVEQHETLTDMGELTLKS